MSRPRALERLTDHHAEILAIINQKEPLLNHPDQRDVAGLALARWALMRAMTAYQLFKERELFTPLLAKAPPSQSHQLLRARAAGAALADELRAYVQRWSASNVKAEWAAYRPAALNMGARIRDQLQRDRAELERFKSASDV